MTALALRGPLPRRTVAAATALAALAGVVLGLIVAPDPPPPAPAPPPEPRVGLASGVARLPLPADWRPLGRRSTLPGFEDATAVRAGGAEAALDLRSPEHASLLPRSVVAAAGGPLPAPQVRGPDGRRAWRYDLPSGIAAYALPTTGGVITLACAAPDARLERVAPTCERAVATIRLRDAAALAPTRETAAAILLPAAVERLDAVRRGARRRLAATRSPGARSAAALRLAAAYGAAASTLRPVAGGEARALTATLAQLARDHRRLAAASRARRGIAARRAGARIERRERRVAALLARLTGPGARS